MRKFRISILVFFLLINSCSKQDEIDSLNELVDTLGNEIAQLNSEIDNYSNQIAQLITENNAFSVQISGLNDQLNSLQNDIQNYIDEIQVLTESNELLQSENNTLTNQLTDLQDQLYDIQSQSAESGIYIFNQIDLTDPPFSGTMWDLPDLISSSDYTVYSTSIYEGIELSLIHI